MSARKSLPFMVGVWWRRSVGLVLLWGLAAALGWFQGALLPPTMRLPHLPHVAAVPWLENTDYHSSTRQLYGALFAGLATAVLFELAKGRCVARGDRRSYLMMVLAQYVVALDVFLCNAPDWGALALSLLLSGGTREFPFHQIPDWPVLSLATIGALILSDCAAGAFVARGPTAA